MLLPGRCSSLTQQQSALTMIDAASLPMWLVDGDPRSGTSVQQRLRRSHEQRASRCIRRAGRRGGRFGAEPRFGHLASIQGVGLRLARRAYRHLGRRTGGGRRNPCRAARRRESSPRRLSGAIQARRWPCSRSSGPICPRWPWPPRSRGGRAGACRRRGEGAPTTALGVVSVSRGPWQSMRGGEIDARIELDARLRGTAEGGVARECGGSGLRHDGVRATPACLVIPSATIGRVASKLETHGRIARGYLGLGLQPVTIEGGASGVMVMSVDPKGPGRQPNIHQGDVLVSWDGKPIAELRRCCDRLGRTASGRSWRPSCGEAARRIRSSFRSGKAAGLKDLSARDRLTIGDRGRRSRSRRRIAAALADVEGLQLVGRTTIMICSSLPLPRQVRDIALTPREVEVLALLSEGASNKLIARRLGISAHTAKYHVASLLDKLDAVSRTDAVAQAARIGVIHL